MEMVLDILSGKLSPMVFIQILSIFSGKNSEKCLSHKKKSFPVSIYKGALSLPPYRTQHTGPVLSIEAKDKIKETLTARPVLA